MAIESLGRGNIKESVERVLERPLIVMQRERARERETDRQTDREVERDRERQRSAKEGEALRDRSTDIRLGRWRNETER